MVERAGETSGSHGQNEVSAPVFILSWLSLLCLAASTGTAIASLRVMMEQRFGAGSQAGGSFVAVHVVGTIAGAAVARLYFRDRRADLRRVFVAATVLSTVLNLAMLRASDLEFLFLLRFLEGMTHVTAVSVLMSAAAQAECAEQRSARTGALGVALVLGVGLGIFLGAASARLALGAAFGLSAALNVAALLAAGLFLPRPSMASTQGSVASCPADPRAISVALLVLGERFALGVATIALPYTARGLSEVSTHARTLGLLMLASVLAMPFARRVAARVGALPVAHTAAVLLALCLFAALGPNVVTRLGAGWAALTGACAGSLFVGCLAHVSELSDAHARTRSMGAVHAAGSLGFALGSYLCGGFLAGPESLAFHPQQVIAILGGGGVVLAVLLSTVRSEQAVGPRHGPWERARG